ncbi:hypothetical protein LOC67_05585 [Stieleria sp. JC731]|uniref:hypothetical protein n=1 Tax=Pirellulaceae TaxID=2691357 RepID=UPI001E3F967E|nr:hypothetical protein [Stieleria sp. JC731]MCC9600026.1 hypothetical protein [Stieleria sp. JC731]
MSNRILNVFPGQAEGTRLVLAQESESGSQSQLVLRQENYSPHVGWFVQSRVVIENDQATALKMTLTSSLMNAAPTTRSGGDQQQPSYADQTKPAELKIFSAIAG